MKLKVLVFLGIISLSFSGIGRAEIGVKEGSASQAIQQTETVSTPIVVKNKICPVMGGEIAEEMMGKMTVEYNGKIYNLCCPGCREAFLSDPEKFSKIAEDSVEVEQPMAK